MLIEHWDEFKECIDECKKIIKERQPSSREASLVLTKLDEALMWFKGSNEDTSN